MGDTQEDGTSTATPTPIVVDGAPSPPFVVDVSPVAATTNISAEAEISGGPTSDGVAPAPAQTAGGASLAPGTGSADPSGRVPEGAPQVLPIPGHGIPSLFSSEPTPGAQLLATSTAAETVETMVSNNPALAPMHAMLSVLLAGQTNTLSRQI